MDSMKKNLLLLIVLSFVLAFCSNDITSEKYRFVIDQEGILTDEQEENLVELYRLHELETSNEIALLTTDNFGTDDDILTYSLDFANKAKIGKRKLDNGVLIVLSKTKRQTRISVGYGLEDILKDEIVKNYIDTIMIPEFKSGNYYEGVLKGSQAIIAFLELPKNKVFVE